MDALVERDDALCTLRERLHAAAGGGRLALVCGEAGIGKTSLLRELAASHPAASVWWGACDALQTPHPLGPLLDIARDASPLFARCLAGPRPALFGAVLAELSAVATPLLMVVEDAHWADEATLDLIKFLGRRIERTHALLVVTFRDDEVALGHPLQRVIGELPPAALTRVALARLSPAGVATLARRSLRSPQGLHELTQGNPFFVAELLRHSGDSVPPTVQALLVARLGRLSERAQAVVRLASVAPGRIERWLLDAVLAPSAAEIDACLDGGVLVADASSLAFRHELARVAIESALSVPAAQALHQRVLAALVASGRHVAPARLAHHALGAGDAAAVRLHAPLAAEQARERGAHREAAAHYRAALDATPGGDDDDRLRWLEAFAEACMIVNRLDDGIAARRELGAAHRRRGDVLREAYNLSRLAIFHVAVLDNEAADSASRQAVALLESLPPTRELALAYWHEAHLRMLNRDCVESTRRARQAIDLAERLGESETALRARSTLGTALLFLDYDAGRAEMAAVLETARAQGSHAIAALTCSNLGSGSGEVFRFATAERWLRESIAICHEHEFDATRLYAQSWLALCALALGRWNEAGDIASDVLARGHPARPRSAPPSVPSISDLMAQLALGRLRARRGDPGADGLLDEALAQALRSGTLQRVAPVRAARAEAAFLRGDAAAAAAEAGAALPLAQHHGHPWFVGELALWQWRGGALAAAPQGCAQPFALQIGGRWREAAAAWAELGCPYEHAQALADGDADAQREALAVFDRLGARPAAEALRRRLRSAGVRGVARGARASTRAHPHGLTARELQVLELLCAGLRNAEIAQRLSRSVRTVDHHVAAVFAKLGVDSRLAAVQAAQRAGLGAARRSG
jgi:DNA-binding CsgD family transcriptional regulator